MKNLKFRLQHFAFVLLMLMARFSAFAQITPRQDAYINTASAATNFGTAATLGVVSSSSSIQTTYIQFDLSSVPAGYKSANVAKATLKLFVNSVSSNGSFNVDFVNGSWSEKTITADLLPALGTTIKGTVPLTSASVNDYITVDLTTAVGEWLNGTQANDGIALVPNSPLSATFQSKENTLQSHPAELDIVFTSGSSGTITGVTAGSGLQGGGTSGTVGLSLLKSCSTNQVLQWNGSAWVCASAGTGTISGVTAGTGLTGGGTTGAVTVSIDPTLVPLLNTSNSFSGSISANGEISSVVTADSSTAIYGLSDSLGGTGVGVWGDSNSVNSQSIGVFGAGEFGTGVLGYTNAGKATAVIGENRSFSQVGSTLSALANDYNIGNPILEGGGVWGDAGPGAYDYLQSGNYGVLGTADQGFAGFFVNNWGTHPAVGAYNKNGPPFAAWNLSNTSGCSIDALGNINCTGSKNAVVPVDGGKRVVALAAIESPVNWFEDAGSAQLANGAALVQLDSDFTQTVNTEKEYQVFLTPYGDCRGLYVTNRTASSFEVHELGGGTAHVNFGYRIMAVRKNYESVRFADHTNDTIGRMMRHVASPIPAGKPRVVPVRPAAVQARAAADRRKSK